MQTIGKLLETKGNQIWSIAPDRSVYDAIALMAEKEVGALVVLEREKIVGIISERDYARKVILKGKSSKDTPIHSIMTKRVIHARPEQTVDQCMAIMTEKRIRHLPVLEGQKLVGMISIGDLVRATIAEQTFLIEQLEHYIGS